MAGRGNLTFWGIVVFLLFPWFRQGGVQHMDSQWVNLIYVLGSLALAGVAQHFLDQAAADERRWRQDWPKIQEWLRNGGHRDQDVERMLQAVEDRLNRDLGAAEKTQGR